jgi:major membrane immunogen (membrane-anchored lipoprotein)
MKQSTLITLIGIVLSLLILGCAPEEAAETETEAQAEAEETEAMDGLEDGIYFAEGEFSEQSGWKNVVILEVDGGEIAEVTWTGAHEQNGVPKYERSQQGEYGMMENSDAMAPWFEQVDAVTSWLLENQDVSELSLDDEGRPDGISGASINVGGFKSLVQEALDRGPVGYGMWEDGVWSAAQDEFSENGWKATVNITVVGGRIVAVEWDSVNEEGEFKADLSQEGEYGMVEQTDAIAPWHEQANATEQWLIENQDPSEVTLNDDGVADAVSGASINLSGFKSLAMEALEGHQR